MCVIIIKPEGFNLPSEQELYYAKVCNPHGFGFVTENRLYKTLNFGSFMREIKKVKRDENCIIHFRLATHGSIKKANCHPFQKGNIAFCHNGVLSIHPDGDKTDSQTAFDNILYPIADAYGIDSPELARAAKSIIGGSKFAFMQDDKIVTFGQFTSHRGLLYSNERHLRLMPHEVSWDEYLSLR